MDTTERMMIMGMCLQGLLANPKHSAPQSRFDAETKEIVDDPEADAAQIAYNIKRAHQYADALDPPPQVTAAEVIAKLTKVAYETLRAADADNAGKWLPFDEGRTSAYNEDQDRVDGVFERVSRWYHDPVGFPETLQDRIIAAIVAASKGDTP